MEDTSLEAAADAIARGELIVYPTETVYGLGADALDSAAIERVFEVKGRPRDRPLSLGTADVATALEYVEISGRTRECMDAFLPGPVTVVCPKADTVPEALTGGRERVGIRVPDHDLARHLLERTGPITATSANRSSAGSVTRLDQLDERVREGAAVVLDGGETSGSESTVVDPQRGEIIRPGARADDVRAWIADHHG